MADITNCTNSNNMEIPKIVTLANRLAESILMDWDKEEQTKLAWETASECNKIITKFHNERGC